MNGDNGKNDFTLMRKPSSAVEKAAPSAKRVLSGMVEDTLALTKTQQLKLRIVIVDGDADILQLTELVICEYFKEARVLTFQDGDKAWQELQREDPDIFITNLHRPNSMDGWEMIPLLAKKKVKYPIVLSTALTKGFELHQKTVSALNGKDETLLNKIQSGEFKDEDLQDRSPSDEVQNLLRRVSPPLDITFLAKPYGNEELYKLIASNLIK